MLYFLGLESGSSKNSLGALTIAPSGPKVHGWVQEFQAHSGHSARKAAQARLDPGLENAKTAINMAVLRGQALSQT